MTPGRVIVAALALVGVSVWGLVEVAADPQKPRARTADPSTLADSSTLPAPGAAQAAAASVILGGIGPDVIVGDIFNFKHYTSTGDVNGMHAYAIGTISCNVGTENLNWVAETNQHPVIAQNLYRLKEGRFEQVGQSWLKHGFFALWESLCAECSGSYSSCNGDCLVVGCSDPYHASLNGDNSGLGLGPKSQVNATTGFFPYPHNQSNCGTGSICERLQVRKADIDRNGLGMRTVYFVEAQYIAPDDALAGNDDNNASYRQVWFNVSYGMTFNTPGVPGNSATVKTQPAITAWLAADENVEMQIVDIPGDGRIHVAWKVTDRGDGSWSYEYAVHNLNSHRAIGSLSMSVSDATTVTDVGFHDVAYHSGELIDGTDWPGRHNGGELLWATKPFSANQNANAIRWGTLYNFRFVANSPPVDGRLTLGLFRPPTIESHVTSVMTTAKVPQWMPLPCAADIVSSATFEAPGDGTVNAADLAYLLSAWGANPGSPADMVDNQTFAPPPDGTIDAADLAFLLGAWGPCP
jgi:hypothetical protein